MFNELDRICIRLPAGSAFSGLTAAWLHGLDTGRLERVEVTVPLTAGTARGRRLLVRRAQLLEGDVVLRHALPTTSIVRTLADLALKLPVVEAVGYADMALHHRLTSREELETWLAGRTGRPGSARFRRVLEQVDPAAESPMESRFRLLLRDARLPAPQSQVDLTDSTGRILARVDFYYPERRLCLEFDGAGHRDRMTEDLRRQNQLLAAGYRLLRFTGPDVLQSPGAVVAQVRAALGA